MRLLKFINRPEFKLRSSYDEAINIISSDLIKIEGVKAIYQFGNITTPGISDLDLLVVVKNNIKIQQNGFENYPSKLKYLFTHGIMALCEDHFEKNNYYSIWSDYHLINGINSISENGVKRSNEEETILKKQIALEFILMNYIDIKIQLEYGVIKLRSLLQHIKGIKYDLAFLNITHISLNQLLEELNYWIKNWFNETPSDKALSDFVFRFDKVYQLFVEEIFYKEIIYLPTAESVKISKKIIIENSNSISFTRNGFVLPPIIHLFAGNKFIKMQNKLNSFNFHAPFTNSSKDQILVDRFIFLSEMKTYNDIYLPNFSTLTSSITAKII